MNIINLITDCFELYDLILQPVWKNNGMTKIELDILLFLVDNPLHDTAADIIDIRKLTKSHVSSAIKKLCKKKYLEKYYSDNNKKSQHLKILPTADKIINEGKQAQKSFYDYVLKGISEQELEIFQKVYDKLEFNIKDSLIKI